MLTVKIAASIGGDADTAASAAGVIAGAFKGLSSISQEMLELVEDVNHLGLEQYARSLTNLAQR